MDRRDLLGETVEVNYNIPPAGKGRVRTTGELVGYSMVPMFLIQEKNGNKLWWREDLVTVINSNNNQKENKMEQIPAIEDRHCFRSEPHTPHMWHSQFRCSGAGLDEEGYVKPTRETSKPEPEQDATTELLDGRRSTYGNVTENAERVAMIWNGYLGTNIITPADMMMMMALYKAYRFKVTPDYSDNINDVLGYAKIVQQVQEETGGLIDAETVKEYLAKKADLEKESADEMTHILRDIVQNKLDQTDGGTIESWAKKSGNPYANIGNDD